MNSYASLRRRVLKDPQAQLAKDEDLSVDNPLSQNPGGYPFPLPLFPRSSLKAIKQAIHMI